MRREEMRKTGNRHASFIDSLDVLSSSTSYNRSYYGEVSQDHVGPARLAPPEQLSGARTADAATRTHQRQDPAVHADAEEGEEAHDEEEGRAGGEKEDREETRDSAASAITCLTAPQARGPRRARAIRRGDRYKSP